MQYCEELELFMFKAVGVCDTRQRLKNYRDIKPTVSLAFSY